MPSTNRARPWWQRFAIPALLAATVVAFSPALDGPFFFDDGPGIVANRSIRTLWPLSTPLQPDSTSPIAGRPIPNLTLAVNYAINGALGIDQRPDPAGPTKTVGYHVVNLLLHLGCGLLLIALLRRTIAAQRFSERWARHADSIALLVGGTWLLHPLQTESVNYVLQRTEIIVGIFLLGTLYAASRARDAAGTVRERTWQAVAVACCALGMASKEVMFAAPILVLLFDRAFHATSWKALRPRTGFYAALASTWIVLAIILSSTPRNQSVGFHLGMSWYEYLYTQGWAILHYLRLVFIPTALTIDYGQSAVRGLGGLPGMIIVGSLLVLTIICWTRLPRWGWAAFAGAWFFLILGPSSSVVPIVTEVAAERRMYLPLAAVLVAIVAAGDWLLQRAPGARRLVAPAAVLLLLALGIGTFARSGVYSSGEMLWRDAIAKQPHNTRAYTSLAELLMYSQPPRFAEAESLLRQAIRQDSSYAPGWTSLAWIAGQQQRVYEQRALLDTALAVEPDNIYSLHALGTLYIRHGNVDAGMPLLQRAVAKYPSDALSYALLSQGLAVAGKRDSAALAAREAARLADTDDVFALRVAARTMLANDHPEDAARYLTEALALTPGDVGLITELAEAKATLGLYAESIELFERALRLDPAFEPAVRGVRAVRAIIR